MVASIRYPLHSLQQIWSLTSTNLTLRSICRRKRWKSRMLELSSLNTSNANSWPTTITTHPPLYHLVRCVTNYVWHMNLITSGRGGKPLTRHNSRDVILAGIIHIVTLSSQLSAFLPQVPCAMAYFISIFLSSLNTPLTASYSLNPWAFSSLLWLSSNHNLRYPSSVWSVELI